MYALRFEFAYSASAPPLPFPPSCVVLTIASLPNSNAFEIPSHIFVAIWCSITHTTSTMLHVFTRFVWFNIWMLERWTKFEFCELQLGATAQSQRVFIPQGVPGSEGIAVRWSDILIESVGIHCFISNFNLYYANITIILLHFW